VKGKLDAFTTKASLHTLRSPQCNFSPKIKENPRLMAATIEQSPAAVDPNYDRMKELTEFDETKAGVKGLIDSGIKHIPRIFLHAPEDLPKTSDCHGTSLQVPAVDLQGINDAVRRQEIVEEVREASKCWGFFQLVNHGIPLEVLDGMLNGTKNFHEQDREVKAKFYSRELMKKVKYECNFDLFRSPAANWRDTLSCVFDGSLGPEDLPSVCR